MYWNFNKNTWTLNCNTGILSKEIGQKYACFYPHNTQKAGFRNGVPRFAVTKIQHFPAESK